MQLINKMYEDEDFRFVVRFDERPVQMFEGYFQAARLEFLRMRDERVNFYALTGDSAKSCLKSHIGPQADQAGYHSAIIFWPSGQSEK